MSVSEYQCISLDCGRKTHARSRFEPRTFFLWVNGVNHCTTTPPCCLWSQLLTFPPVSVSQIHTENTLNGLKLHGKFNSGESELWFHIHAALHPAEAVAGRRCSIHHCDLLLRLQHPDSTSLRFTRSSDKLVLDLILKIASGPMGEEVTFVCNQAVKMYKCEMWHNIYLSFSFLWFIFVDNSGHRSVRSSYNIQ